MEHQRPRGIARFDSATGMARAIGAFLHGRDFASLSGSTLADLVMPLTNYLPGRAADWIYSVGGVTEAISADSIERISFDAISRWIVDLFPRRGYPAAFIGSSNGALTHLAAALQVPWLPQTFLCPIRRPWSDPDDVARAFSDGRQVTERLLKAQPSMSVHHMHDPNQDRLMLRTMSYFRLKHRSLPPAYRDFLSHCLPAGATIYIDECTHEWPVTRTSDRSVFQFGAVGGLQPVEYFEGNEELRRYFRRYRVNREKWNPPAPDDSAPEAEWGFDPALMEDLVNLAHKRAWRIVRLRFDHPEALSPLTVALYKAWYESLGISAARLLVESFILLGPRHALRLHALPLWLVFAVRPSQQRLADFLDRQPRFDEIDLLLFSHGTEGAGLAGMAGWRRQLAKARLRGRFIGVNENRYPRDFATFSHFNRALTDLGPSCDLPPPMALKMFEDLLRLHAASNDVVVEYNEDPGRQSAHACQHDRPRSAIPSRLDPSKPNAGNHACD